MLGMAMEPLTGCQTTACGAPCPPNLVQTNSTLCPDSTQKYRCCPPAPYPDVVALIDRGNNPCTSLVDPLPGFDNSLVTTQWSTAKEALLLPGPHACKGGG
jgi:hypothetical protein